MLYSVVTCYQELLHAVQCCYMLHCAVEFCATVLYVVMCSCMLCSVVTCYSSYYMCTVLLHVMSYYMLCSVVTCYIVLLNVQQCYML